MSPFWWAISVWDIWTPYILEIITLLRFYFLMEQISTKFTLFFFLYFASFCGIHFLPIIFFVVSWNFLFINESPLDIAIKINSMEMVKFLVDYGADVNKILILFLFIFINVLCDFFSFLIYHLLIRFFLFLDLSFIYIIFFLFIFVNILYNYFSFDIYHCFIQFSFFSYLSLLNNIYYLFIFNIVLFYLLLYHLIHFIFIFIIALWNSLYIYDIFLILMNAPSVVQFKQSHLSLLSSWWNLVQMSMSHFFSIFSYPILLNRNFILFIFIFALCNLISFHINRWFLKFSLLTYLLLL